MFYTRTCTGRIMLLVSLTSPDFMSFSGLFSVATLNCGPITEYSNQKDFSPDFHTKTPYLKYYHGLLYLIRT